MDNTDRVPHRRQPVLPGPGPLAAVRVGALSAGGSDYVESAQFFPPPPGKPGEFSLIYPDARSRFPLPDWLDSFLDSQPSWNHTTMLSDPDRKFLVMTCHKFGGTHLESCGGFSDRMALLPFYLWLAHRSGRMLLIKYSNPFPLENFFVPPPQSGFDWTVPPGYLVKEFEAYANRNRGQYRFGRRAQWDRLLFEEPYLSQRTIIVNNNLAIPMMGVRMRGTTGLMRELAFPGIFRRMFHPSPSLAKTITAIAERNGLAPGNYAAAHFRAKFPAGLNGAIQLRNPHGDKQGGGIKMTDMTTRRSIHNMTDNAVGCVLSVMPEARAVYFASDSSEPIEYLMTDSPWRTHFVENEMKQQEHSTVSSAAADSPDFPLVVTRPNSTIEPMHIDRGQGGKVHRDDGTFDSDKDAVAATFIDLWIMAHARCTAQGVGGFAHFSSELTGNHYSCRVRHRNYTQFNTCYRSVP
eukprot:CAMPEP_0113528066 /NCGR_PEP_ID=MMETSP0015_2-20120614/1637_1 /TAXON_ID=2838 /ORGANISM="Odontella" /LENGTH=463 /DNA_ID=CAMNT_0000426555 /DNA_START=143 /DNA_END=1532 /DNA_ORIENTATION=+ /assembly_acc=CAM_ASM_000160